MFRFRRPERMEEDLEPPFQPSTSRLAVAIPNIHPLVKPIEHPPKEWGLDVIAMFGPVNYGKRKVAWYHAGLHGCQVPYVSSLFEVFDAPETEDPRKGEADGSYSKFNGRTIVSMDLSVNNISSLASGSLAAFVYLRRLDLSCNCLDQLNGLGAAPNLKELNLSTNRISSEEALRHDKGLGGLEKLKGLTKLDLSYNKLAGISPIFPLTNLTVLDVTANRLKSLEGVEALPKLRVLLAKKNRLRHVTPELTPKDALGDFKRLRSDMANVVRTWATLPKSLTELDVSSNEIADAQLILGPLKPVASSLLSLSLRGNPFPMEGIRWSIIEAHRGLKRLDGQELQSKLLQRLEAMHRVDDINKALQQTKEAIANQLRQQERRKDWSLRSLRIQEEQVDTMYFKLKGKLEAEYEMAAAEVAAIVRGRAGYWKESTHEVTPEEVAEAKALAGAVARSNGEHIKQFESKMPRQWDLPRNWEAVDPNFESATNADEPGRDDLQAILMKRIGKLDPPFVSPDEKSQSPGGGSPDGSFRSRLPGVKSPRQRIAVKASDRWKRALQARISAIGAVRELKSAAGEKKMFPPIRAVSAA